MEHVISWPEIAAPYGVSPLIHEDDFLWQFLLRRPHLPTAEAAAERYFEGGAYSAERLRVILSDYLDPAHGTVAFLEFASGYGMVTRHLRRVLGNGTEIVCCDIHPAAVDFIRQALDEAAIVSHRVPEKVQFGRSFDIVFALSFFSHMPEATFGRWLRVLYDALAPTGLLVFTTHGRASIQHIGDVSIPPSGFFFRPTSEQQDLDSADYGTTVTTPEYVKGIIRKIRGARLLECREAFWWNHQDLFIVARHNSLLARIRRPTTSRAVRGEMTHARASAADEHVVRQQPDCGHSDG